jgi:hypothetical protein
MRRITFLIRNFLFWPLINSNAQTIVTSSDRFSCIDSHGLTDVQKCYRFRAFNFASFVFHPLQIDMTQNSINRNGTLSRKTPGPMRRAYCTICKIIVDIRSSSYVRLANHRAAIEGFCPICNSILLNTRIMPTSSKKPRGIKKKREKLSIYSSPR